MAELIVMIGELVLLVGAGVWIFFLVRRNRRLEDYSSELYRLLDDKQRDLMDLKKEKEKQTENFNKLAEANSNLRCEISKLRENNRLNDSANVTRLERYMYPIKDLRHYITLDPHEFKDLKEEELQYVVEEELAKKLFESARPYIEITAVDNFDMYRMQKTYTGRLRVINPEEAK